MYVQQTIKQPITCSGIGLHTGAQVQMTFKPAGIGSGIVFKRIDLAHHPLLKVQAGNIGDTSYATTLGRGADSIKTIEHVLAALQGLGITNALIDIDGSEAPILDGSAACFVDLLLDAGIETQGAATTILQIRRPLEVRHKDSIISIEPYNGFKMTYTIDFPNPLIGTQTRTFTFSPLRFMEEIAHARTFCMYEEIEYLWKMGLSKGGSLDNAVVFAQDRLLNNALRYPDEPVRHKILDLIGDLVFLGHPLSGHLKVYKGGHVLHTKLVRAILDQPSCWTYLTPRDAAETPPDSAFPYAAMFPLEKTTPAFLRA